MEAQALVLYQVAKAASEDRLVSARACKLVSMEAQVLVSFLAAKAVSERACRLD